MEVNRWNDDGGALYSCVDCGMRIQSMENDGRCLRCAGLTEPEPSHEEFLKEQAQIFRDAIQKTRRPFNRRVYERRLAETEAELKKLRGE